MKTWLIYMARCADNSLYCGITNDIQKRLKAHNAGKGAKYIIKKRRPVILVYQEAAKTKGAALSREIAIKKLTKKKKEALVATGFFSPTLKKVMEASGGNLDGS